MKKLSILILLSLSFALHSANVAEILPVLKLVESMGNTKSIGDNGKAYGILQIHKVCVDDVNRIYGTDYTHQDAFEENCAEEIFHLYLQAGIRRFVNKYKKEPTEQDVVRMWNGGVYSGYKRSTTIKYYRRYLLFKRRHEKEKTKK